MFFPAPSKKIPMKFFSLIFSLSVVSFKILIQPAKNTALIKNKQIVNKRVVIKVCAIKARCATRLSAIKYKTKVKVTEGFSLTAKNDFLINPENI